MCESPTLSSNYTAICGSSVFKACLTIVLESPLAIEVELFKREETVYHVCRVCLLPIWGFTSTFVAFYSSKKALLIKVKGKKVDIDDIFAALEAVEAEACG